MEGHVIAAAATVLKLPRSLWLLLPLCLFLAPPAFAQLSGRWKITIESATGSPQAGELRLEPDGSTSGGLLLESRDSAWAPVTGLTIDSAGLVRFTARISEPARFEGQAEGDDFRGTATDGHQRKYRWAAVRIGPDDEYYAAPPRFRQQQIVIPAAEAHYRIPGRWLAAARAAGETAEAEIARYRAVATRAGIAPLPNDSLGTAVLYRAMGVLNRAEFMAAAVQTLEKIRSHLPSDTTARRFDYLFRPQGTWLVDVHAVALARAQRPFPALTWESARPALAAAGRLDNPAPGIEAIPLALYRLFALSHSDTAAFHAAQQLIRQSEPASVAAVAALLQGYEDASQWYLAAVRFLVERRWIATSAGRRSPADLVHDAWGGETAIPDLQIRVFGYPEGAERVGIPADVLTLIVKPDNAPARDWLARHGTPDLIETLHRLSFSHPDRMLLDLGGESYALSSVGEVAAASFSGFLEPRDAILLDPSYQPLLALGTVIHEWQHILHEHRRQVDPRARGFRLEGRQVMVRQLDPFIAEGMAEWLTEVILEPVSVDYPIVALGEAEKRVSLPDENPHHVGYRLVRVLAATLRDVPATMNLLIRGGSEPAVIMSDRRLVSAWSRFAGADRLISRRGGPVLVPQMLFTVEDAIPELLESRILGPE